MDITSLSFVADRDGKALPKYDRKKDRLPRCFWHVPKIADETKPGGYTTNSTLGERLALEYLAYEETSDVGAPMLANIVCDMPRPLTGVEVGFLQIVGYAASAGAARARRVSKHWEISRQQEEAR